MFGDRDLELSPRSPEQLETVVCIEAYAASQTETATLADVLPISDEFRDSAAPP